MRSRLAFLTALLVAAAACGSGEGKETAALEWQRIAAPCSYDSHVSPVPFDDAFFAMCWLDGTVWRSPDGRDWTLTADLDSFLGSLAWQSIGYDGEGFTFAATGSGLVLRSGAVLLFSADGVAWQEADGVVLEGRLEGSTGGLLDFSDAFAAGPSGAIVVARTHRRAWISADGRSYVETTVPQFDSTTTVHVTDDVFVLTALELPISRDNPRPPWSNVAWYSSDGIEWNRTPPGPMLDSPFMLSGGAMGSGGMGSSRSTATGHDGQYLAIPGILVLTDAIPGASLLPAGTTLLKSPDGITWSEADLGLRGEPVRAATGPLGTLLVTHAETPIWWYSADGITAWEQAPQEISSPDDNQVLELPDGEFFAPESFAVAALDPDRYAPAVGTNAVVVFDRFRPGMLLVGTPAG